MNVHKLLDIKNLEARAEQGLIARQKHPNLPLLIYNYTHEAQRMSPAEWDHEMSICRGLIVTENGEVIARPFMKFWNYGQAVGWEILPHGLPEVTEKLDGSLGIYWKYKDFEGIATRGSFTSEQSQWATYRLKTKTKIKVACFHWPDGYTPLFEIIYKENQIVVKYDYEDLVLLSLVDIETGEEPSYRHICRIMDSYPGRIVKCFSKTIAQCLAENNPNEEGYVLTWKHEEGCGSPPMRTKVKFPDYMRLHRLLTGVNPKAIWEILSTSARATDDLRQLTENTTEDFTNWVRKWSDKLTGDVADIQERAIKVHKDYLESLPIDGRWLEPGEISAAVKEARKRAAAHFNNYPDIAPILFKMWSNEPYTKLLWKLVKPQGVDTFRQET